MDDKILRSQIRRKLAVRHSREKKSKVKEETSESILCDSSAVDKNIPHNSERSESEIDQRVNQSVLEDNSYRNDEQYNFNRFSSDDDSDSESENEGTDEGQDDDNINIDCGIASVIRQWATDCNIAYSHIDCLLKGLKPFIPDLPLSHKTLFKTDINKFKIEKFNPDDESDTAEFVYFGIDKQLQSTINLGLHSTPLLEIQFNMDGLPLFKSSAKEFWLILGQVHKNRATYEPFTVAVYCGLGKPKSVKLFLNKFVEELNIILNAEVDIRGKRFLIKVKCFVCDRPARSFIKCIKGHTGYYSCERCVEKGYRESNRTLFSCTTGEKRNDQSFREQKNVEHHNDISPLILVDPKIDMVNQFVLDFMHLGCLGITKKLLEYWTSITTTKLERTKILRISQRMMNLSNQIPSEFQRTTRSLGELSKWKATEYRFFLLYCGACVLKDILSPTLLNHFLLFSVACRILSCDQLFAKFDNHAQKYLESFVVLSKQLYGVESQVLNMHNLIHLVDDVRNMECSLSDITAFPFENKLGSIKRKLKSGNRPLAQLCRRMEKDFVFNKIPETLPAICEILRSKKSTDRINIQRIKYRDCELTLKSPNNVILLKTGEIVKIKEMYSLATSTSAYHELTLQLKHLQPTYISNTVYIIGTKLEIINDAFTYPSKSSVLNIFQVKENSSMSVKCFIQNVECKMILFSIFELPEDEKEDYVVPLLHIR